jgi:Kef-type K+ transport system membrane component KefB
VLWLLSLTSGIAADQQSLFALSLAQGGEFAFVLVSFCTQAGVCWGRA